MTTIPDLTLRDYLAERALALIRHDLHGGQWKDSTYSEISEKAYKIADAMLAERKIPELDQPTSRTEVGQS